MADARDILGVPDKKKRRSMPENGRSAASLASYIEQPSLSKPSAAKPKPKQSSTTNLIGLSTMQTLSREMQRLLKDDKLAEDDVINIANQLNDAKEQQRAAERPLPSLTRPVRKWVKAPICFGAAASKSARLERWVHADESDKSYAFERFYQAPQLLSYTDEEFAQLPDDDWTREGTDALLDLLDTYHMRWHAVQGNWDVERYGAKTVEDLRERYFNVRNQLERQRSEREEREPVYVGYDGEHERRRKEQAERLWKRTQKQVDEEKTLKKEMKKIEARRRERQAKKHKVAEQMRKQTASGRSSPSESEVALKRRTTRRSAAKAEGKKKSSSAKLLGKSEKREKRKAPGMKKKDMTAAQRKKRRLPRVLVQRRDELDNDDDDDDHVLQPRELRFGIGRQQAVTSRRNLTYLPSIPRRKSDAIVAMLTRIGLGPNQDVFYNGEGTCEALKNLKSALSHLADLKPAIERELIEADRLLVELRQLQEPPPGLLEDLETVRLAIDTTASRIRRSSPSSRSSSAAVRLVDAICSTAELPPGVLHWRHRASIRTPQFKTELED